MSDLDSAGLAIADTMFRWGLEDENDVKLDGWIYFISCAEMRAIKIGYTKHHPKKRLSQLQTGCPSPLVLIGWYPGCLQWERDLHGQLADFALQGEWFRLDEAMSDIIAGPIKNIQINNALTGWEP